MGINLFQEMTRAPQANITELLLAWGRGDQQALEMIVPRVQAELHRLAAHYMAGEKHGHMLQATALVNEVYLKLVDWDGVQWTDRAHFFGIAAGMMRRVLVDYARFNGRAKRGGNVVQVSLSHAGDAVISSGADVIALDEALNEMERVSPRQVRVIELRFFGGLSLDETAEALRVSVATVRRDWSLGRAWLFRELNRKGAS